MIACKYIAKERIRPGILRDLCLFIYKPLGFSFKCFLVSKVIHFCIFHNYRQPFLCVQALPECDLLQESEKITISS